MDIQTILVYIIVLLAFGYLLLKFAFPKVLATILGKKGNNSCGGNECNGCH